MLIEQQMNGVHVPSSWTPFGSRAFFEYVTLFTLVLNMLLHNR